MKTADYLRFGYRTFTAHFAGLLSIGVAIAASQAIVHWALGFIALRALADAVEVLLSGLFVAGLFNACRSAALGRVPRLADAFEPFVRRPLQALAASAALSAGLLLFGVGVLITGFLFVFSLLLVCEGDSGWRALLHSKRLVLSNPVRVLALLGALALLNLLGALALGIGLLVTTPISLLSLIALRLELESEYTAGSAARGGSLARHAH